MLKCCELINRKKFNEKIPFIAFDIVERCKIDDEECLIKAAHVLISKHNTGECFILILHKLINLKNKGASIIGLPSIDPITIEELKVVQNLNSVNIDGGISNATMTGLSKGKFTRFLITPEGKVEIKFFIPLAIVDGPYDVTGQILKLKLKGKGIVKSTFSKINLIN